MTRGFGSNRLTTRVFLGPRSSLRMKVAWSVLLVVMLALSGCTGAPSEDGPADVGDSGEVVVDPVTGDEQPVHRVPVSFGDGPPVLVEEDVEGHFDLQEHGDPGGDVQQIAGRDPGNHHRYDISEHVPVGVPTRIVLEVDADLEHGDLDLWLDVPAEEIWTSEANAPTGGYTWIAFHVVRSGQADIGVVVIYDDLEPAPGFDYTLRLTVESDPAVLLAGVPVALPVPRDALALELAFQDDPPTRVWFWGPDDEVIGVEPSDNGDWTVALSVAGDHVLLLPEGSPMAVVSLLLPQTTEAPTPLRFDLLRQQITQTEEVAFDVDTPGETTFEVAGVPIQMGLQIDIDRATKDVHATLEGPEGMLINVAFTDDVPFHTVSPDGGFSFTILTDIGREGLTEGTHTATFRGDPNGAGALSAWIIHYARA